MDGQCPVESISDTLVNFSINSFLKITLHIFGQELLEATKTLVNIQTIQKFSAIEPTLTSTSNLKLAFIVKDNSFKRPIFMDPSNTSMLGLTTVI